MGSLLLTKEKKCKAVKSNICASALVDTLVKLGVDSVFGYPGAAVLSIYNELSKTKKITHYLVRHEQAALHAAEGYARISGKPGVVLVTSGPGFTNTITGIANAYADSTPLVVLAGDVAKESKSGKVFQNVDILTMTQSCTKKTYVLTGNDDISQILTDGYNTAKSGVKGPVVIILPRNLLESVYLPKIKLKKPEKITPYNNLKKINKFVSLVNSSKKPLILVGGGASVAAEEVRKFTSLINCPVVSTLMGIGNFPSENEKYLGMIGMNGTYTANTALANCDLLICFGVSFSDRSTCKSSHFAKNAKIININLNPQNISCELGIKTDVREFLTLALKEKYNNNIDLWNNRIKTLKEEDIGAESNTRCLHSSFVLKTISEFTKTKEPVVVTDVGQHQMLTAQFFNFNKPGKFVTSGGLGTMGFGLPAAIGAYIANPNNLVLNITGDGSYQMNLQELATCREHDIPIKIIIMNNGYLGMVRQMQEKIYNNRYQVEMTNPDFVKIAEAYDLFAIRVSKKEELIPALKKAIEYKGTAIIDIKIDSFEEI